MQRRLRITMAVVAAAGIAVLGAGTAEAQGTFHASTDKDKGCSRKVDKDKPAKESDFPNDMYEQSKANANDKDLLDASGDPYLTHTDFCTPDKPWRGYDWHDKSYDTFHNRKGPDGVPVQDNKHNSYDDVDGYNDKLRKDPHKYTKLEPDHIGAPKNPKYASE